MPSTSTKIVRFMKTVLVYLFCDIDLILLVPQRSLSILYKNWFTGQLISLTFNKTFLVMHKLLKLNLKKFTWHWLKSRFFQVNTFQITLRSFVCVVQYTFNLLMNSLLLNCSMICQRRCVILLFVGQILVFNYFVK